MQANQTIALTLTKNFRGMTYLTFLAALRRVCLLGASSSSSSSSEDSCFFFFPRWALGCFLTRGLGTVLEWDDKKTMTVLLYRSVFISNRYHSFSQGRGTYVGLTRRMLEMYVPGSPFLWDSNSLEICIFHMDMMLMPTVRQHWQETQWVLRQRFATDPQDDLI